MGPEWLNEILDWIRHNPELSGLAIGAIAFLEGLALVGILIPGIVILFGVGALVGLDVIELRTAWFWASVGAIIGDAVSFWIGRHFKQHLRQVWPFSRFGHLIHRGEQFFRRHGLKSIIIGRFVGPVRPIMPVVAGMMRMPLRRYVPANIVAGILWAPAYLLPGVIFGASLELARSVALRLSLLLCLLAALIWALSWLVQEAYLYLAPRTSRMLGYLMAWGQRHPAIGRFTRPLVDPSRPESGTLTVFALLLALAAGGLASLLIVIPVAGAPLAMDQGAQGLMQALRTPWADRLMAVFNGLGDILVLLPASLIVFAWLWWRKRRLAAWHWAAAVCFGLLLAVVISYVVSISRAAAVPQAPGEMLPLMHVAMSVVIYGFFAILIARELPRKRRMWPYAVATLLVGLIGLARLYFGAHWLSDLLVGAFFGILWVTVLGIAYRRRVRRSFWMAPLAGIFFTVVGAGTLVYALYGSERLLRAYAPALLRETVAAEAWWQGGWTPPESFVADLNVQYTGNIAALAQALEDDGWIRPPMASWAFMFEMIQPRPTPKTLPVLPSAYQGRPESLVLQRHIEDANEQWILRMWPTGILLDGEKPLWVGQVDRHRIDQVAWFFSYWRRAEDGDAAVDRLSLDLEEFVRYRNEQGEPMLLIGRG